MAKTNLVASLFDKDHPFEIAVMCSYGLDLNFFENYLLNLNALLPCEQISLFVDQSTYDGFRDASYAPRSLNKRYLVTPVRSKGVFHPKLYILASEKKALFGLGSPNLTRDGIASNLEILTTFEVSKSKQEYTALLINCIDYVQRIAQKTQSEQALKHADELSILCSSFVSDAEDGDIRFIHNLDGPLFDQILKAVGGKAIDRIQVISPFYDAQLKSLRSLQKQLPDCQFEIFLQQGKSNFPIATAGRHLDRSSISLFRGIDRYLHGKALLIHSDGNSFLFMGSANFTDPAMLQNSQTGNYEIGIIGSVDTETAGDILKPAGHKAEPVADLNEVTTHEELEFARRGSALLDYLIEASLDQNRIVYRVVPSPDFQPQKYLLVDCFDNFVEGELSADFNIDLLVKARKKLSGGYTLQILGVNGEGDEVYSNRVWVINLEEKTGDRQQRRMRRIFSDPQQLFDVLKEIADEGDERELMLFLKAFDIPLDLLLPPRTSRGVRHVRTKGDVIGTLPTHKRSLFTDTVLTAYDDCLNKLYRKMQRHRQNVQPEKIGNFLLLFNSSQTLLNFVNSWARDRYLPRQTIDSEDWVLIRDCYDMLLKHCDLLWRLVWAKDGYRNAVNARISEMIDEGDEDDIDDFDQHLLLDYGKSIDEFIEYTMEPVNTFKALKNQLLIKIPGKAPRRPKVFANRHLYLEPPELEKLTVVLSVDTPRLLHTTWQG